MEILDLNKKYVKTFSEIPSLILESEINKLPILSFSIPKHLGSYFKAEYTVIIPEGEFIIKEKKKVGNTYDIYAKPDIDSMNKTFIESYNYQLMTLKDMSTKFLYLSDWVLVCNDSKKTTFKGEAGVPFDMLQEALKLFEYEFYYDVKKKLIIAGPTVGSDKGAYFHDEVNLKEINLSSQTYDLVTRLVPYGKDGLTIKDVNNGLAYVESTNNQYGKIIYGVWKDERYTVPENLKSAAQKMVDKYSAEYQAYEVDLINLSKLSDKYSYLEYGLGDTVTIIDNENKTRVAQRVVSKKEYLNDRLKDTVSISNLPLTIRNITKNISDLEEVLEVKFEDVLNSMPSADGFNKVWYGETLPPEEMVKVGDIRFTPDPLDPAKTQMLIWNGEIWEDPLKLQELETKINDNIKIIATAQQTAEAASQKVDDEVARINNNIVTLTDDLNTSITQVDTTSKNNYGELKEKVTDLTTALEDKPDKTYVDQTIDEKTGTITQTIGQIETKVNELDEVPVYTIGTDGYWYKDGVKTDTLAVGKDGQSGVDGANFTWNILKGTQTPLRIPATGVATHQFAGSSQVNVIDKLGKYTFSADVKVLAGTTDKVTVFLYKNANNSGTRVDAPIINGKIVATVETTEKTVLPSALLIYAGFAGQTLNNAIELSNYKLEYGENKNPTWSPHISELKGADGKDAMFVGATPPSDTSMPWLDTNTNIIKIWYNGAWHDSNEEVKTKLNTVVDTVDEHTQTIAQVNADLKKKVETSVFSTFKQEYDSIVSTVQKTETDLNGLKESTTTQLNEQKQTLEANISKISNIEKDLTSGTTFQKIQTIEETAEGNKTTIAAVKKTAEGAVQLTNFNNTINTVNASISTIGKSVEGIQIGGRNLISSLTTYRSMVNISSITKSDKNSLRVGLSGGSATFRANKVLSGNGWYTISGWARGTQSYAGTFYVDIADGVKSPSWTFDNANNWLYFSYSYEVKNYTEAIYNFVDFNLVNHLWYEFKELKLEKGNKATDWSPAPEDMASLTVFNEFKRTAEQTLSVISDPTQKGLLSAINQQAGQILLQVGDAGTKTKILLTKEAAYMDAAFIESAHIGKGVINEGHFGDITFNWATGKTLNAQKVNVINIDANNITANKTSFVQSAWNAINSSLTIDGNGMKIDGDWGGAIHFTRRGQTYYDKIKGQVMGYQYGLYRNTDDPLVNSQMLGIYLAAEMGYDLRLGIRKEIDNQNNTYMAIKSAGGTNTWAQVFGATTFLSGIDLNGTSLKNAANAGYEIISNENGVCLKFSNGYKIQWKRLGYTTRSTGFEGWGYPVAFTGVPFVVGSAARDDATAANANIAFSNVNNSACNVRISDKANSYSIMVIAIGV